MQSKAEQSKVLKESEIERYIKDFKIEVPLDSGKFYICPSSPSNEDLVRFRGCCPVTKCPANLARFDAGVKKGSNCFHIEFVNGSGDKISPKDIAYAFNLPLKDVEKSIAVSTFKLKRVMTLRKILSLGRRTLLNVNKRCPKCKVPGKPCLNLARCEERLEFLTGMLKIEPFNYPTLALTVADLYALATQRKSLANELQVHFNRPNAIKLHDWLGITKEGADYFFAINDVLVTRGYSKPN